MNIETTIRSYLPQIMHMSLSTCLDSRPWTCEVHFAYDDSLQLYFCSKPSRRHSQEIEQNPCVSGSIVTQHFLKQKVRGVYFEGQAKRIVGLDEVHPGYLAYTQRFGGGPDLIIEAAKPDGHAMYQITVEKYYLFDAYESNPSQKYTLVWSQSQDKS